MITDIRKNNIKQYVYHFQANPERFAKKLSNIEVKEYGVCNNEFWKSFIINIDKLNDDSQFKDNGLYENLARMYFVTLKGQKYYLVEKFIVDLKPHDEKEISRLAVQLKDKGVDVDVNSAVLVNKEKQVYKFTRYQINKD